MAQDSPSVLQVRPPTGGTAWQVEGVPEQRVEQQSPAAEQPSPVDLQELTAQTPPAQAPVQHSSAVVQAAPAFLHTAAQEPPWQRAEQQSEPTVQACPTSWHTAAQEPEAQLPEQHCVPVVQAAPPARHADGQAPLTQVPEQQGLAASQGVGAYTQSGGGVPPPSPEEDLQPGAASSRAVKEAARTMRCMETPGPGRGAPARWRKVCAPPRRGRTVLLRRYQRRCDLHPGGVLSAPRRRGYAERVDRSIELAPDAALRPIGDVGAELGLGPDELELHGPHVAKVSGWALRRRAADPGRPGGRLVVVTAITPTPAGEGKTTTAVGLVDALRRLGTRAALTVRQPSLGPVFGMKGGGNGGGRAQVVPRATFNLHLTGDFHAVAAAHNLAAAMLDSHLNHGNALGIEPGSASWPRCVDVNDRALRDVVIGLGGRAHGPVRETEWVITAASEVMAALSLADDLADLRRRLGRTVVARDRQGRPVTLEALRAAGAMAALLVDAVRPNLLQTLEGSPVLAHTGPFGNIAPGTSSVIADRLALRCADVVVTEAGFGADLGAEKLFDLKCRQSALRPAAAVVVATVRALRMHGGAGRGLNGKALAAAIELPDREAVARGLENLRLQVGIVRDFGVPVVVALNEHPGDRADEQELALRAAREAGAAAAVTCRHFVEGGVGALDLARAVLEAAARGAPGFRTLYPDEMALPDKIETLARRVYRADGVDLARAAVAQLDELAAQGQGRLPVCMAKTPYSLSHDPLLGPNPTGWRLPVREVRLYAGAGYVTALAGEIVLMPGLPAHPAAEEIDVTPDGRITGLR